MLSLKEALTKTLDIVEIKDPSSPAEPVTADTPLTQIGASGVLGHSDVVQIGASAGGM